MHLCVNKLSTIVSDNGLSPGRRQAIIWTSAGILLIGPLGTNFSEILIEIYTFSFKKMHLKMSSGKWPPFCLGLNVLIPKIFASRFQALIGGCLVNAVGYPQRPFPIGRASIWSVQWDVCSQNGGSLPWQLCDNYTGTSCVREWGVRSSGKWWPTFMRWTSDVFALINPYFKCLILWYICQHSCLKSRFLFQCLILWYICQHSCMFKSFSWLNIIFIILDVLMFTKHVPGPWVSIEGVGGRQKDQSHFLIARFMGPTWGPSGTDRTQVGPMLAPWTLLSGTGWTTA